MDSLADLSAERLEATFDGPTPLTVGLEEEVMLLHPDTLDLSPCASEVLSRLDGDPRFKPELPASQLEIMTQPTATARDAVAALARGRRDLAQAVDGLALPAVAGVHPFAAAEGELTSSERSERLLAEYGEVARRQLVTSLQVHVAVGGAGRTLAVYNALRGHLPEIAALAANAPFYQGRDIGLASVRPKIAELLPRQGMPPPIRSWAEFAADLQWGVASGTVVEPRRWWWELRPHPGFGTLEVRVPDAQTTLSGAAGVVAMVQGLVAWLSARHDAGETLPSEPTWRIEESRWSAARDGVEGEMADLRTGEREPTRQRLRRVLAELAPLAGPLGLETLLTHALELVAVNGAIRQREVATRVGVPGVVAWLGDRFLEDCESWTRS